MLLDIIVKDGLDIQWCESIVWLTRKNEVPSQTKSIGVKYKEVGGDKDKALKLAIQRYIAGVELE